MPGNFAPFESKMRADGLSDAAVIDMAESVRAVCVL